MSHYRWRVTFIICKSPLFPSLNSLSFETSIFVDIIVSLNFFLVRVSFPLLQYQNGNFTGTFCFDALHYSFLVHQCYNAIVYLYVVFWVLLLIRVESGYFAGVFLFPQLVMPIWMLCAFHFLCGEFSRKLGEMERNGLLNFLSWSDELKNPSSFSALSPMALFCSVSLGLPNLRFTELKVWGLMSLYMFRRSTENWIQ